MKVLFCFLFFAISSDAHFGLAQDVEVVFTSGHLDMINSIDVSQDGEWFVSGSVDNIVKMTHIPTGRELRSFAGANGTPSMLKFSPDSKLIVGLFNSGEVKIWRVATGEILLDITLQVSSMDIDFVLDSKFIMVNDEKNHLFLISIDGKTRRELSQIGIFRISASADGKSIFGYDYEGMLHKIDIESGSILASTQVHSEFIYIPARMTVDPNNKFIALALDDHTIHLFDTETLKLKGKLTGHTSRIWATDVKYDGTTIWSCEHNGDIIVWDAKTYKKINSYKPGTFNTMTLRAHPSSPILFIADGKEVLYLNPESGNIIRRYSPTANKVINLSYSPANNQLAAATLDVNLKIWDLQKGKVERVIAGFWPVTYSEKGKHIIAMNNTIQLGVWDSETGALLHQLNTGRELIQHLSVSKDEKTLAGGGYMGIVKIWDLENKKLAHQLSGHSGGVLSSDFHPSKNILASSGMDGTIHIWDSKKGALITKIDTAHQIVASDVKFNHSGTLMASCGWDNKIHIWDTQTWKKIKTLKGHHNMIKTISWHSSDKYLVSGAGNNAVSVADNSAIVWDVNTSEIVCRYSQHEGAINKVIFDSNDPDAVISTGDDGSIRFWDFKNCSERVKLYSMNQTDHVLVTPEHYYTASKSALNGISFRKLDPLYPFEQFDLWLNRPDIVLDRLNKSPENLIQAYKYVYEKRVQKNGFSIDEVGGEFHLPELSILSENIPVVTKDTLVEIIVLAKDSKYSLKSINVKVNNVPVNNISSEQLKDKKVQELKYTVKLRLSPGENEIKISAMNSRGVESLTKTRTILREDDQNTGTLYLVCIGVSEYKEEKYNLNYAAKDATDIRDALTKNNMNYTSVQSLLLTNKNVSFASLDSIQSFIASSNEDDAVIIFAAGHGVLDEHYDYYFGSYAIDFSQPVNGGIPYEAFTKILSQSKSRKKLLIMDTCHSGELDKDEIKSAKENVIEIEDIEFRNVGNSIATENAFGFGNSVELMQNLFTDITSETGATILSSSGGAEFAMEGEQWKNGLFTYVLLDGILNNKADTDWNREIQLSELRKYVYKKVVEISKGQQRPGAREENIIVDFRVY